VQVFDIVLPTTDGSKDLLTIQERPDLGEGKRVLQGAERGLGEAKTGLQGKVSPLYSPHTDQERLPPCRGLLL